MNRYRVIIGLLLGVATVLVVLTLMPAKRTAASGETDAVSPGAKASGERAARPSPVKRIGRTPPARSGTDGRADKAASDDQPVEARAPAAAASPAEAKTPREQAVAAWESLVDRVIEEKDVPAEEQSKRVKEAFDKLDKEDQMDGIHRSLNLFPDEQFPSLYGILFDKTEDPEVLDAIFSDALNRPEELKNPLMKELVKDKEHPCFFESARILDVMGELHVKPAPAPAPTPSP